MYCILSSKNNMSTFNGFKTLHNKTGYNSRTRYDDGYEYAGDLNIAHKLLRGFSNIKDFNISPTANVDTNFIRIIIIPSFSILQKIKYKGYPYTEDIKILNYVILSDRYNIFNIKTIKKMKLNITDDYIASASVLGHINVLEWWKQSGLPLKYSEKAIELASSKNNIDVLEWWKHSGLPLKYDSKLLAICFERGVMDVLRWWKHSGLPFDLPGYPNLIPYLTCDIDKVYDKDYTDLIDWFISLKIYKIVYTNIPIDRASKMCNLNVLEWWKKSGLPLKYSEKALDNASKHGHINVLAWWFNSNLPLKYTKCAIDNASRHGHINVLEWWINSKLGLQYSKYALNMTIKNGDEKTLNWWINSGLPLKYSCKYKNIINIKIPKKTKIYSYYIL